MRRRAYTLVEILIVVAILALAGAMVVPALSSVHVLRVQAAVRTVVADITYAQSNALAFQEPRAIVFDEESNGYVLVEVPGDVVDPINSAVYDPRGPGQRYAVDFTLPHFAGSRIANVNFDGESTLIFDALGGPVRRPGSDEPGSGGSLDVVGSMSTFRIRVAPFTGRVTVEELEAASEDPEAEPDA